MAIRYSHVLRDPEKANMVKNNKAASKISGFLKLYLVKRYNNETNASAVWFANWFA
jgi:ribosome-binding protein aMBF1 (putative translation factor)